MKFVDCVVVLSPLEVGTDLADKRGAVTLGNVEFLCLGDAILLVEENRVVCG